METELISVIIPIYNVEKYLRECINSVVSQTYRNIEIILVDDGSTDHSPQICDEYQLKDTRIKVIHQKNQGVSVARNIGLNYSRGKYIFWIDSDDYISKECIESLYELLRKENVDMSICNYIQGSDRNYIFKHENSYIETFDSKKGLEYIYKNHHYSFIMAASWAKLIKKELYEELKYPVDKIFEDIYMSHHLINKCKKIAYVNQVMYYYYQWPESILGKKFYKEKLDYLDAFEERIYFFDNLGYQELKEKARIQYLHALIWEYSRAKDILHDHKMIRNIVTKYKQYYQIGTFNEKVKHETKWYMFKFYLSPYCTNFIDKVKCKMSRKGD